MISTSCRRTMMVCSLILALGISASACSNDGSSPSASEQSESAMPFSNGPADYRSALIARLSIEWGDQDLARSVIAGLDDGAIRSIEARIPIADVATASLLEYRFDPVPADRIDSLVVFAFGYRDLLDGTSAPGPINEALAATTATFVQNHPVPVFAQHEIAALLSAQGVPGVVSIDPETAPDGEVLYLSTTGVAAQALRKATTAGIDLGTVGIVGFDGHEGRCILTARSIGMDAVKPAEVTLPATYDAESGQAWTRGRENYLTADLLGRMIAL